MSYWTSGEREYLSGVVDFKSLDCLPLDVYGQVQEQLRKANGSVVAEIATTIPASFDWRDRGLVTPVKFQGQCRSCWAFAAAAAIETLWASKTKQLVDVSPQAFVDCQKITGFFGCNGAQMMRESAHWCGQHVSSSACSIAAPMLK